MPATRPWVAYSASTRSRSLGCAHRPSSAVVLPMASLGATPNKATQASLTSLVTPFSSTVLDGMGLARNSAENRSSDSRNASSCSFCDAVSASTSAILLLKLRNA